MHWRDLLAEVVQEKERFVGAAIRRVLSRGHGDCQEEVHQEVFIRVDQKFESWLWNVSRNVALEHRRKCDPNSVLFEESERGSAAQDDTEEEGLGEQSYAMQAAIVALPRDERMAYRLVKIERWTLRPVAKKLKCSVGHVHDLVFRADAKIHQAVNRGVLCVVVRAEDGKPAGGVPILLLSPSPTTREPSLTDRHGKVLCKGLIPGHHALQLGTASPDPVQILPGMNIRRYKADSQGGFTALQEDGNARS